MEMWWNLPSWKEPAWSPLEWLRTVARQFIVFTLCSHILTIPTFFTFRVQAVILGPFNDQRVSFPHGMLGSMFIHSLHRDWQQPNNRWWTISIWQDHVWPCFGFISGAVWVKGLRSSIYMLSDHFHRSLSVLLFLHHSNTNTMHTLLSHETCSRKQYFLLTFVDNHNNNHSRHPLTPKFARACEGSNETFSDRSECSE